MEIDPKNFVALAFLIFVGLLWRPVSKVMARALDKRADRIRHELDEAIRLKEEAQAILVNYKKRQMKVHEEAEEILEHARVEAGRIVSNAKVQMESDIKKRMEIALQRIAIAEASAIKDIRDNAVDITVGTARALIIENLNKDAAQAIIENAMSSIDRKFN